MSSILIALTIQWIYIEIKGFKEPEFENKMKYFPRPIKLIDKNDIKPFIEYVKLKYGNDIKSLYQGNPHNDKLNKCEICGNPAKNRFCSQSCCGKNVSKIFHGNQYTTKS